MPSPVSPSDHVTPPAALPAAQYAASRHAAWLGAAAIITDEVGRVLLVHPTYRKDDSWLLPGGVVEPGEHPHITCRREITEELGLDLPLSAVLTVHSFSPHHPDLQPGTPCPGEVRFVFDGGTLTPDQVEAIRLPRDELSEYAFLETRDAVQRLRPVDGQIMLAAYRARLGNTATAQLADGRHILDVPALHRHDVHVRYRPLWDSPLHRLRIADTTSDLVRRHAAGLPAGIAPQEERRPASTHGTVLNVIGVHLYLERPDGTVLLGLRHPNSAFAPSTWHVLAGHCEQENAITCLIREAQEEAGLHIERQDVELVHVIHHIDKAGDRPRMGLFFRARAWTGEPELREPDKCTQWRFWEPSALPDDLVPYTRVAIAKIQNGELYSETGWPA
ncbi:MULTISPECIES: NUDIX domain-containing protein [unclassified Streptomyces]|uniref:NUDIX domain-containing protein n=1 Tax=unclassified Streptomyces TaxID=2593676 RepID=UPI0035DD8022